MPRIKLSGVLFMFLLITPYLFAQEKLDKEPFPVGGMTAIAKNIVYPADAKKNGVEGKVFVRAIISETGIVKSAEIERGAHKLLNEAALDAVRKTKFEPGEKEGKKIEAQVVIPIMFKLDEKKK